VAHNKWLVLLVLATGWTLPARVSAQSPDSRPLPRGEAAASIGWLNANKSSLSSFSSNNWSNSGLYGGGTFGWHWTEHHKIEIDGAASRSGRFFAYEPIIVGGVNTTRYSDYRFVTGRLAVSERYQFRHNAWFHPHVGGGVELVRETTREDTEPVFAFDPVTRQTRQVQVPDDDAATHITARPCVDIGFKTYLSPRGFFRTDFRLSARSRIEDVLLRFGFGVDF
jgi:opacity protein-like surface antigen